MKTTLGLGNLVQALLDRVDLRLGLLALRVLVQSGELLPGLPSLLASFFRCLLGASRAVLELLQPVLLLLPT